MRKLIIAVMVCGLLAAPATVFAWGPPSISKGGDSGAAKVDVKALTGKELLIKVKVHNATVTLANSLAEIKSACGDAASAEKLKSTIKDCQAKKDDIEKTKVLIAEVNKAAEEVNKIDLQAKVDLSKARKSLGKSLLYLGAGILLDLSAVNDAKALMNDVSSGLKAVQASPMTYGPSAARDLTSALNTTKFVSETVPPQASSAQQLTKKLVEYAKTNKIEIPSAKDQEALAKDMEKE